MMKIGVLGELERNVFVKLTRVDVVGLNGEEGMKGLEGEF